jgi:hypothetical protein
MAKGLAAVIRNAPDRREAVSSLAEAEAALAAGRAIDEQGVSGPPVFGSGGHSFAECIT